MDVDEALGIARYLEKFPPEPDDTSIEARQKATVIALGNEVERLRAVVEAVRRYFTGHPQEAAEVGKVLADFLFGAAK